MLTLESIYHACFSIYQYVKKKYDSRRNVFNSNVVVNGEMILLNWLITTKHSSHKIPLYIEGTNLLLIFTLMLWMGKVSCIGMSILMDYLISREWKDN